MWVSLCVGNAGLRAGEKIMTVGPDRPTEETGASPQQAAWGPAPTGQP
jgi:hypothetical protein